MENKNTQKNPTSTRLEPGPLLKALDHVNLHTLPFPAYRIVKK